MNDPLLLTDAQLENLGMTPADIVAAIEDGLAAMAEGAVQVTPKSNIVTPDGRYLMSTLSVSHKAGMIAVKTVSLNEKNKARGLPMINGAMQLYDSETGILKAVMGANWVTAVRTAGLSAVAARRLALPQSSVLGLIGAGVQAESHMRAFADIIPLKDVRIFGRSRAGMEATAAVAAELGLTARFCDRPEEALEGADIVVTSVTLDYTIAPFLDATWLKPGAFAAITDLAIPWRDESMTAIDALYIDDLEQERGAAKPMVDPDCVQGDLAGLVAHPPSLDPTARRAFVFRGIAIGDLSVAVAAYQRAIKQGETA